MKYFPIFQDVAARKVLVAGGGEAAAQKVRLMLKTEADVHVVAADANAELVDLAADARITLHARPFDQTDLEAASLVFVATNDDALDADVSAAARARNIPINVVDKPALSSFVTPAIVDRDPLVIAIGTEGAAPVLAQGIKSRLETLLPPRLGALVQKARVLRPLVARRLADGARRRAFWTSFFFGGLRDAFLAGGGYDFETRVDAALSHAEAAGRGRVVLVGAGPGDPELMTLKAQRMLQSADVIVHDARVGADILEYARRDAERVPVDVAAGAAARERLAGDLAALARAGRMVVHLEGGDPCTFGRGTQELALLEAQGIDVEIVPGVTTLATARPRRTAEDRKRLESAA